MDDRRQTLASREQEAPKKVHVWRERRSRFGDLVQWDVRTQSIIRLGDDLAGAPFVDVRVHQTRDQGLAETEAGFQGGDLAIARDGVGRE